MIVCSNGLIYKPHHRYSLEVIKNTFRQMEHFILYTFVFVFRAVLGGQRALLRTHASYASSYMPTRKMRVSGFGLLLLPN